MIQNSYSFFTSVLRTRPHAIAVLAGSAAFPEIHGMVRFYGTKYGVLVSANVRGLPPAYGACGGRIFGFHIHEGGACTGDEQDPFAGALTHYSKEKCPHPYHSGDMPPLFGADGKAFSVFLTDRFTVNEIVGRTVIVHDMPDDFRTQPSGGAGTKIACGVITA
ncbi:MAG: superoxide dismutase family protein [Clostridia bacterium]|nr:superoxide dismutase family protein [Clostridia bacterium]